MMTMDMHIVKTVGTTVMLITCVVLSPSDTVWGQELQSIQ